MLRVMHGKIELFVARPAHLPGLLLCWPQKRWCALVPSGNEPSPVWLKSQGLGCAQAEAVSEAWRLAVRPTLNSIETLSGTIAKALHIAQPMPATRKAQVDQLMELTRCRDGFHTMEALRMLERRDRVLMDVADGELVWWVNAPADMVSPADLRSLHLVPGR